MKKNALLAPNWSIVQAASVRSMKSTMIQAAHHVMDDESSRAPRNRSILGSQYLANILPLCADPCWTMKIGWMNGST